MKSFAVIAAAAGIASAASSGWGATHYVTDVVTAYTTYCPEATKITHGDVTYTVTSATTLTISNCPCTITRPVSSFVSASSICSTKPASVASATPATTKSAASSGATAPVAPVSSTYYAPVVKPSSSATTSASATSYTGAASKAQVAGGLLAALGLVAAAL